MCQCRLRHAEYKITHLEQIGIASFCRYPKKCFSLINSIVAKGEIRISNPSIKYRSLDVLNGVHGNEWYRGLGTGEKIANHSPNPGGVEHASY